jgi:hypothetical protein
VGFNREGVEFLTWCRNSVGVDFSRTATLGRQSLHAKPEQLAQAAGLDMSDLVAGWTGYAEPLLELLGAKEVESIDASSFEGATVVHDLNTPLPPSLHGRFSAVVDGGTLEHIFDFPTALRAALAMVADGGHFLAMSPTNQNPGHGFYQISPELWFRVLQPEVSGFRIDRVLLCAVNGRRWFELRDPATMHRRVEFVTMRPAYLYVVARRVGDLGDVFPQQSDYALRWTNEDAGSNPHGGRSSVRRLRRLLLPAKRVAHRMGVRRYILDRHAFRRVHL